jgi:asparagine synthase (glutamine-hydrolysing)
MAPVDRYVSWMSPFPDERRRRLLTPELTESLDGSYPADGIHAAWAASSATDLLDRMLDVDVKTYLPDDLLVKMDIATMAHSVEARSPLLDPAVMELAAGLPVEMKLAGGTTKRVFKRAVRDWLPAGLADRPKMGFRIPFAEWLRGPLRDLPGDVLLDPRALGRGLFRPDRLRALVAEQRDGTRDHAQRIWTLLALELWFQTYVDRAPVDAPVTLSSA